MSRILKRRDPKRLRLATLFMLVLACTLVAVAPMLAETPQASQTTDSAPSQDSPAATEVPDDELPVKIDKEDAPALPTGQELVEQFQQRFEGLKDISGVALIREYDGPTGKVLREAEIEAQAVFPNILRFTFRKPETMVGSAFVVEADLNRLYIYSPVYDMVQCATPEQFAASYGMDLSALNLFGVPHGDHWESVRVIRIEELDGVAHAVVQVRATDSLQDQMDDVAETLDDAFGRSLGVSVEDTAYLWIDMERLTPTKIEEYNREGKLRYSAEFRSIVMDAGLTAAVLKNFRRADIHPSCRL